MPLPTITAVGNLVRDPELRFTNSGKGVVNFTVACNDRKKNEAGEWVDGDTTYLDAVSWFAAEQIADELKKGQRVIVTGSLKQRNYETKDGEKRTAYEINADSVAPVIRDGQSAPRPATTPASDPWANAATQATEETTF
jgi:single-strand DNA-binding protein